MTLQETIAFDPFSSVANQLPTDLIDGDTPQEILDAPEQGEAPYSLGEYDLAPEPVESAAADTDYTESAPYTGYGSFELEVEPEAQPHRPKHGHGRRHEEADTDGYSPRTRETKRNYDSRGESRQGGKGKGTRRTASSPEEEFKHRMSRILGVRPQRVPELFVNSGDKAVRVNALRMPNTTAEGRDQALADALYEGGIDAEPLHWLPGVQLFDVADTGAVQALPLTEEGGAYIQNPSSLLPVLALEARPGQRVLDMCSAPGGKASLIAALTHNEADLTVNELKPRRMERLKEVLSLLGVRAEYRSDDGKHLPQLLGEGSFERVLLDAECSTEAGVNFEAREPLQDWSVDRINRMSRLQLQLAKAGYDLLQPGGVMVYSTCSLAPEENELVIAELLRRRDAVLQPLVFEAERLAPRLREWQGHAIPKVIGERTLRVMPSRHMEGFFVARIVKPLNDGSTIPEAVSLDQIAEEGL